METAALTVILDTTQMEMAMRMTPYMIVAAVFLSAFAPREAQALETSLGTLNVQKIVGGLDQPWGFDFLPGGALLVTERDGRLLHIGPDGAEQNVRGVPDVVADGQGGLLDVMIPRDFASSREVFLSFSIAQPRGGAGTALARGVLSSDGTSLSDLRVLFQSARGSSGGRHFGSRIVEAVDGSLFLTIGDRGDRPSAQDLRNHNGSVIRINRTGSVPRDNPFIGQPGAEPEIWSYGHRNPQGAALDLDGKLWVVEHLSLIHISEPTRPY